MKKLIVLSLMLLLLSGCQAFPKEKDDQEKKELQSDLEDLEEKVKDLEDKLAEKEDMEIKILDIDTSKMAEPKSENSFELQSPDDGDTFFKLPIVFKGSIDGEAEAVVVTAVGGEGPHADKYKDIYELKDFKEGDSTFTYRASPQWDNLAIGENEYEFKVFFTNGETMTEEMTVNYVYDGDGEIAFDGCGDPTKYKNQKWYGKLRDKFNAEGLIAYQKPVYFDEWNKNFDDYGANELCYADNGGVVVLVSSGEYCSFGNVYRYFVDSGVLEEASYPAETGCSTLGEFQKRTGNIIPMTGGFGDAGCFSEDYYKYDFIRNIITRDKSYFGCYNEETGEKDGQWTYY